MLVVDPAAREEWLRNLPEERLARIAANFSQIASCVSERKPDAALTAILEETEAFCEWTAAAGSAKTQSLLLNVKTALGTWRQVWPRLGAQREFRLAVAREADLWSRRLQAMGEGA